MKISSETIKELDENKELENIKKIEAALFLSARYLTLQDLVLLTDINPLMLKDTMLVLSFGFSGPYKIIFGIFNNSSLKRFDKY